MRLLRARWPIVRDPPDGQQDEERSRREEQNACGRIRPCAVQQGERCRAHGFVGRALHELRRAVADRAEITTSECRDERVERFVTRKVTRERWESPILRLLLRALGLLAHSA